MTTTDLERRLAEALQRHAEDAMNKTHTEEKLETLLADVNRDGRRRRTGWAVGAIVAAAAAVAAVVLVPGLRGGEEVSPGTRPSDVVPATEVATGFLDAYAAFDRPLAASYLYDENAGGDGWRAENRWFEAVGFTLQPESCEEGATTFAGVHVDCPFAYQSLGSQDLGVGPFGDNIYSFIVEDGKIISSDLQLEYESNGFSKQVWEPFAAWVSEQHPQDAAVMYVDWPGMTQQAYSDKAIELWHARTLEYVESQR
jgi:hypothetical protein